MKKRCLLLSLVLGLFLINILLVSAYGSYGSFSLGDFFNDIDEDTMILGAVLVISFAVLNFALARVFRGNTKTAGVVSFALSLLITWGINKSGFDLQGLFYGLGISDGFFSAFLPIIFIIGAIIIVIKLGIGAFFLIMGIFLLMITMFTDLIYSNGTATIIAILFIALGTYIIWKYGWKFSDKDDDEEYRIIRGKRHSKRTRWVF